MVGRITWRYTRETLRHVPFLEDPAQPWQPDVMPCELEAPVSWTEASTAFDRDYLPEETVQQLDYLRTRLAEHARRGFGRSYREVEIVVMEARTPDVGEEPLPTVELEKTRTPGVGLWTHEAAVAEWIARHEDEWVDGAWDDWARRERGGRLYA